jgi:hypothetical protein
MRQVFKSLGLLLLLLLAQHGAVIHELSHVPGFSSAGPGAAPGGADVACTQCPAFAQVLSPTFSHAFQIPPFGRAALELIAEPRYASADGAVARPRSRGPPLPL